MSEYDFFKRLLAVKVTTFLFGKGYYLFPARLICPGFPCWLLRICERVP